MSFWSSQKLKAQLPGLIEPFSEDRIEAASYELSVGDEVFISPQPDTPPKDKKRILLKERETVTIPPGQFAFLITAETVVVPKDAIAFISMRSTKAKFKGLINVSGFHVDPGYRGKLIFAAYNAGPGDVLLGRDERLFTIWYADLDAADEHARIKPGFQDISTALMYMPESVASLPYLKKRLDELEKKLDSYSIKQALMWAIVFGMVSVTIITIGKSALEIWLSGSKPTISAKTLNSSATPNPPTPSEENTGPPSPMLRSPLSLEKDVSGATGP